MKVLIDQHLPFLFGHGGATTQVEQTCAALKQEGVDAEFLNWWDSGQNADLIHFFGTPPARYLNLAKTMHVPVVVHELFTETCNRPPAHLRWQGRLVQSLLAVPFGHGLKQKLGWEAYLKCSHNIVGLAAEKRVLQVVYRVPESRISIVPLGLGEAFLKADNKSREGQHLICTGTITERKCSVELATLARAAQVPVLFVGKPYSQSDPYWGRFKSLIDGQWVKYEAHVADEVKMVSLLQSARGFVLMSWYENWCLSAHEAAACGLPVLVPDQTWSRERFGDRARYFSSVGVGNDNIRVLRQFYKEAPQLSAPVEHHFSWREVACKLKDIYQKVLTSAS